MASVEDEARGPATVDGLAYHEEEIFVDGESLGPEVVSPNSSRSDPDYITSKRVKDETEEGKNKSGKVTNNLKSTLIISGAAVAVIGAMFAIAKKIREA